MSSATSSSSRSSMSSSSSEVKENDPFGNAKLAYHAGFRREGAVYRVHVTNFMTYTSEEIFPGPGVNVILGPNGSGRCS